MRIGLFFGLVIMTLTCRATVMEGYLEALDMTPESTNREVVARLEQDDSETTAFRLILDGSLDLS